MASKIACALIAILVITSRCFAASYSVIDLGTLGGTQSEARSINANAQIAGSATVPDETFRAYLYSGGAMINLGTLPSDAGSVGRAINSSGHVVGNSNLTGFVRAFFYDGTMHDLGQLPGLSSDPQAINDSDQIVGRADFATVDGHAFLYSSGVMQDLGVLGTGRRSSANGINNSGQIVGESTLVPSNNNVTHAFLYDNGTMQDLGTLGGALSRAMAINDFGQIVGEAQPSPNLFHAFLYEGGVMHDLGTLGGFTANALDINNFGQVVGFSRTLVAGVNHAFLYQSGTMHDLNDLIDPLSGWVLTNAAGINDSGLIVGSGTIGGQLHAVLLTPVPEPSAFLSAAVGLAALVVWWSVRRR